MSKVVVKIFVSIAIGVLIGVVIGGIDKNKLVEYYFSYEGPTQDISKELYETQISNPSQVKKVFKKKHFNKDSAIYYRAIIGASLTLILLIPNLIKNKYE